LKEEEKTLLSVLNRKRSDPPPVWMMRQAGRYLPEYREMRSKAGSFWTLCMTPKLASEVTLQPIRRFGFDAAILFSDILVVPVALGAKVEFEEGVGPTLNAISSADGLDRNEAHWSDMLAPVYEALGLVRSGLSSKTTLMGFAGAPWTLATYLSAGRGGDEQKAAKLWAYREPETFARLLDVLVDCVAFHLGKQIEAGADAVQIFDSWASGLPEAQFESWVVAPTKKIVSKIRTIHPKAKIIGFPRAATLAGYERYADETGVDAISLDTAMPPSWAAKTLGGKVALQGNLDPIALIAGGRALQDGIDAILDATRSVPFVFNLGHGILPETPIAHVEEMVARVRGAA
jgi:uroporphyrinogen decarboxylase